MPPNAESDHAGSPVAGIILLIGITIVLAMLVLLLCFGFSLPQGDSVPDTFRIVSVTFVPDSDGTHYRAFVTVSNTDSRHYRNRPLKVITYVNGSKADCSIPTLNNDLFCTLSHAGVWHLWGLGTHGDRNSPLAVWPGNSDISIEYKKEIIHKGDSVTLEVIDTTTDRILSRDTWPAQKKYDTTWFYHRFLNPQAA